MDSQSQHAMTKQKKEQRKQQQHESQCDARRGYNVRSRAQDPKTSRHLMKKGLLELCGLQHHSTHGAGCAGPPDDAAGPCVTN